MGVSSSATRAWVAPAARVGRSRLRFSALAVLLRARARRVRVPAAFRPVRLDDPLALFPAPVEALASALLPAGDPAFDDR